TVSVGCIFAPVAALCGDVRAIGTGGALSVGVRVNPAALQPPAGEKVTLKELAAVSGVPLFFSMMGKVTVVPETLGVPNLLPEGMLFELQVLAQLLLTALVKVARTRSIRP